MHWSKQQIKNSSNPAHKKWHTIASHVNSLKLMVETYLKEFSFIIMYLSDIWLNYFRITISRIFYRSQGKGKTEDTLWVRQNCLFMQIWGMIGLGKCSKFQGGKSVVFAELGCMVVVAVVVVVVVAVGGRWVRFIDFRIFLKDESRGSS